MMFESFAFVAVSLSGRSQRRPKRILFELFAFLIFSIRSNKTPSCSLPDRSAVITQSVFSSSGISRISIDARFHASLHNREKTVSTMIFTDSKTGKYKMGKIQKFVAIQKIIVNKSETP